MDPKLDLFIVYQFLKRLTTPFEKWEAYGYGIIDKDGNVLKTRDQLSEDEAKAWTTFDLLVSNLKKELAKVAGGKQKMSSMIMATYFLRELKGKKAANSETSLQRTKGQIPHWAKIKDVKEDAVAVNNVGGGQIAGVGVGPSGEPGGKKAKLLKTLRRKQPNVGTKVSP